MAQHNQTSSLTPLADGEAGVLDHLRNGDADQREQAYTELEAAVARRDTALLCAWIPPLYEVLCLDAKVVDTAECQRVCLLLGFMICVDHVACGGCVWKDGLFATPFNAGSALGLVREKSESELCAEDAITLACHMLFLEAPWIKGFAAVAVAAGMSEMQMMVAMGSVAPCYPDAARSIKLTELTMDLLRRRQVPDAVVAGCWMVLCFGKIGAHAEVASKRQFDLGIFELGMTELRTGSPMDWARIQDQDDARFASVLTALQQMSLPSPILSVEDISAKAIESGVFQAGLSVIKSAEIIADSSLLSVMGVVQGGLCLLLNMDSESVDVRRSIREAASALRFLLELKPAVVSMEEFAITSATHATILAAIYFGRDEDGGPFSFSQDELDQVLSVTKEMFKAEGWGMFFPLLPNWSSIPDLSLCASDKNKTL